MTLQEQLELAKRVYPGRVVKCYGRKNRIGMWESGIFLEYFEPKLGGTDKQAKQALDVILAAMKLPQAACEQMDGEYLIIIDGDNDFISTGWQPDLLTACSKAILEGGGP